MHHPTLPVRPRTPRTTRQPAPALPPLDALDRTHHQIIQVLADLQHLLDQLPLQDADAAVRHSAKVICQFFDTHARAHHAEEETRVFPLLVRQGDKGLIQHVLRLQQDHGWLEEDWLELQPMLQAVAHGYNGYEIDTLRQGVAVFTTLYQEHIALEESLIYPAARAQLAAESDGHAQRAAAATCAGP